MSTVELRKRLIDKIQNTENENLLGEVNRLLGLETEDIELFTLNEHQKKAVEEGRTQIENGQFFTDEQADRDIDEWLKK